MVFEQVSKNRTIRRFDRSKLITGEDLSYILECAALGASAGNLQRIRYAFLGFEKSLEAFEKISLGGYLKPHEKPTPEVAAVGYLVLLAPNNADDSNLMIDVGIAAEIITLAASERGIGCCMIRNFDREYFTSAASAEAPRLTPVLVIALGYPLEAAKTVGVKDGNIKYYKDENGVNCVPKLSVSDCLVSLID